MIPLFAVSLLLRLQTQDLFPKGASASMPNEIRDWKGFGFLPEGPRTFSNVLPIAADWSKVQPRPHHDATVWRTKVVILDRVDRTHERGKAFVWAGHHGTTPPIVASIKRSLEQMKALVANDTQGRVDLRIDVSEETEALTLEGGDLASLVQRYLTPRINGGKYDAEDNVFRGPYDSVFVIHPVGGETSEPIVVQGTPTALVGLPDVEGYDVDGVLATVLRDRWRTLVSMQAQTAGLPFAMENVEGWTSWEDIESGVRAATDTRVRLASRTDADKGDGGLRHGSEPFDFGPLGNGTYVKIAKDPVRGSVLTYDEVGAYRTGGVALPWVKGWTLDTEKTPTLSFWMKSDSNDPIVLRFIHSSKYPDGPFGPSLSIGRDVPFAYDNAWHRIKIDLRAYKNGIEGIVIGADANARAQLRRSLGPISASFAEFSVGDETPDTKPTPESPSPTAIDPEVRAQWAATAPPGEARRLLLKDPVEAVRANAAMAALAQPDAADEPALIDDSLFTFEQTLFEPSLRALGKLDTPTADEALRRALRAAAADRARGVAAEVLAAKGDAKLVPLFIGLNQARTRAARVSAIRALAMIPGDESALMRMAFLSQADPETKLEVTLTLDPNEDAQARKLMWSAVNEPSDAVRLESLRRLALSTNADFREAGINGIHDDSTGVRVGLLEAWMVAPTPQTVPAIRAALTDASPRVRAAALNALARSEETVTAKDIPFDDPDPRVQLGTLRIAKEKGVPVPAEALERARKSPDAEVRAAAGSV